MAIRIECDNCGHILRNEVDESGAEPEAHTTLKMQVSKADKTIHPISMDLCPKCAKLYLKTLKEPI